MALFYFEAASVHSCNQHTWAEFRLPARAQRFYRHLHKEKHYSQMTLLAGLLAIPLTAGKVYLAMQQLAAQIQAVMPDVCTVAWRQGSIHAAYAPACIRFTAVVYVSDRFCMFTGLAMICILDAYMTRRPASPHPHHQ